MQTVSLPAGSSPSNLRSLARQGATTFVRRSVGDGLALAAGESMALMVALVIGGAFRTLVTGEPAMVLGHTWLVIPMFLVGSVWAQLLPGWGLGAVEELRREVLTLLGVFGLVVVGMWLAGINDGGDQTASRLTLGVAGVLSLVLVPYARISVKKLLVWTGTWGVPAVIYGAGEAGSKIVRQLQEERGIGYEPVAVFDDHPDLWGGYLDTIPVVGTMDRVAPDAAVAFLALPEAESGRQAELLAGPLACYRTVIIIPQLIDGPSLWVRPRDIAGILGLEVTSTLTKAIPQGIKRASDLAIVLALAPFWMPLVWLFSFLIWLEDRGKAIYRQPRVGLNGQTFDAQKLRTMVPDADAALQRALDADADLRLEWETFFKLEKDPRITRVGSLLRRTSLDELPQLFNVLRGEMSLVGPRPLPDYHHEELPERVRSVRERVRPGITGLWQVSGRSDSGNAGMERWDPYYVRNWSLWLDIVILIRTLRVVTHGSGAY